MSGQRQPRLRAPQGATLIGSDEARPETFPRESRAGQTAPSARAASAASHARGDANRRRPASEDAEGLSVHRAKMAAQATAFDEARPASDIAYASGAPARSRQHAELLVWQRTRVQAEVDMLADQQLRLHAGCCPLVTKTRDVVCVHLGYKMVVRVPSLARTCSKASWTPHPYTVGYVPTTPTDGCETWISMDLAMSFKDTYFNNGLAASGESVIRASDQFLRCNLAATADMLLNLLMQPTCACWITWSTSTLLAVQWRWTATGRRLPQRSRPSSSSPQCWSLSRCRTQRTGWGRGAKTLFRSV
jgi:hypothetical protein